MSGVPYTHNLSYPIPSTINKTNVLFRRGQIKKSNMRLGDKERSTYECGPRHSLLGIRNIHLCPFLLSRRGRWHFQTLLMFLTDTSRLQPRSRTPKLIFKIENAQRIHKISLFRRIPWYLLAGEKTLAEDPNSLIPFLFWKRVAKGKWPAYVSFFGILFSEIRIVKCWGVRSGDLCRDLHIIKVGE